MIEPVIQIRNLLRSKLTDPRKNRTANWIFEDWPREDLSYSNFPRISIVEVSETAERMGLRSTCFLHTIGIQISVWVKKDWKADNDASPYYGEEGIILTRHITRDIEEALRQYSIPDLSDTSESLWGYRVISRHIAEFTEPYNLWRIDLTVEVKRFIQ